MSRRPKPAPADDSSLLDETFADLRARPTVPERLTFRLDELASALGVSRRTIERERSAGRFPKPDLCIGKAPLWKPQTIRDWIDKGGRG
jgi:predicted DNA-binding transcriptional regulator AlpA